jgi:hypothetical protein
MEASTPQDWYVNLLMDKVREDDYPSNDHLDRIEATLSSREQAEEYVGLLMEKVDASRYPSKQMLDRIQNVAKRLS